MGAEGREGRTTPAAGDPEDSLQRRRRRMQTGRGSWRPASKDAPEKGPQELRAWRTHPEAPRERKPVGGRAPRVGGGDSQEGVHGFDRPELLGALPQVPPHPWKGRLGPDRTAADCLGWQWGS